MRVPCESATAFLNSETKNSFAKLIDEMRETSIKQYGFAPLLVAQLTHSGRFSKPNGVPEPIVAYRNEYWEKGKENQPYTLASDEYCDGLIEKYRVSAKLAKEVGFDGIDVKCCHGYFFNEFLSAKNRSGKYGGSLENRTRLYFDSIDTVKETVGSDVFVTTRLNACDCFPYPFGYGVNEKNELDLSETKIIIGALADKGIELVNLTLGNPYLIPHINRPSKNAPEDGMVGVKRIYDITKELQQSFPDIRFVMAGLSYMSENCVEFADSALIDGAAAFAGFGRMTFAYPDFYFDYLKNGSLTKNKCCVKCGKCTELMRAGSVTGCPVRDTEIYLPYYKKYVLKSGC